MALSLKIDNFGSPNILRRAQLQANSLPQASNLVLDSTENMTGNSFVVVGNLGTNTSELDKLQTITDSNNVVLTTPLDLQHNQFEAFTLLFGDKIKVYRAPNTTGLVPDDTAFASVATVSIDYNNEITEYIDPDGDSTYWYKFTYYNSGTLSETNLRDSASSRGGGYSYYTSVDSIRNTAGMANNPYITDADIDAKRLEAQQEVDSALQGMYTVPFQAPIDPMISGITRLLAAGKLMMDDPGGSGGNSTIYQEGEDKMAEARAMLQLIDTRQYFLTDTNGNPTINPNSQSSKAFPDATTGYQGPGNAGSSRLWRMSDAEGYSTRRY